MSLMKSLSAMTTAQKVLMAAAILCVFCTLAGNCWICRYWPVTFNVRNPLHEGFADPLAPGVSLTLYTVGWCPYCRQLLESGEWDKVQQSLAGTQIQVGKVDGDASPDLVKAAGVDSYPTIVLVKDGRATKYEGERKSDSIVKWVSLQ